MNIDVGFWLVGFYGCVFKIVVRIYCIKNLMMCNIDVKNRLVNVMLV